ncbi:MAG: nucleotide exchange factor GrpE [Treponema sp.]|nr:nucleotide exchange factor GrpE [Treponema sp.]
MAKEKLSDEEQKKAAAEAEQNAKDSKSQSEKEAEVKEENSAEDSATENESAEEEKKELSPEEKIAALEAENADLKDQLLRRAADFDNYRKRMIKEKQETFDYANASLLGDLLESLDNFDRTVEASSTATDPKAIADGVKMINSNLVKMLENKYGLTGYGAEGDEFNPDEHEAIGRVEEDVEKETLKQVYLKGYKLKDRVIRHAKVMVSVPKA